MHVMIEAYLVSGSAPGATGVGLFTDETLTDTQAQVMTRDQAAALGFGGLPEAPAGVSQLFIVVSKGDERRIINALESNPEVAKFAVHEVNI